MSVLGVYMLLLMLLLLLPPQCRRLSRSGIAAAAAAALLPLSPLPAAADVSCSVCLCVRVGGYLTRTFEM